MTARIGQLAITILFLILATIGCANSAEDPTPAAQKAHTPVETQSPESEFPTAVPTEVGVPAAGVQLEKIAIVYDNTTLDERLSAEWGFAAVIELADTTILFDTGGSGSLLINNLQQMGLDPLDIDAIVLSHEHQDHTGGFYNLLNLGIEPTMYLPASFSPSIKSAASSHGTLIEVSESLEIMPGVHVTGELGGEIPEQALILETKDRTILITGCAHPGIVNIIQQVNEMTGGEIDWVIGGFHLLNHGQNQLDSIIDDFRRLGVGKVVTTHCTGELAISAFSEEYAEDYVEGGVGQILFDSVE